jgi:hypothetical protein
MSGHRELDDLLRTDPQDIGCGEAMELLHVYAELHITDPDETARRYPGVLAHLRACGPCTTDFEGLIALLKE